MNVIFGKQNVDLLGPRYLAFELETFQGVDCFCVLPFEDLIPSDRENLALYQRLHSTLVDNVRRKSYAVCRDIIPQLMGKFNGELDTFYQEILKRSN